MSNELLVDQLTGRKIRIINPKEGADIHAVKHFGGRDFILKAGEHKDIDEAIAKSAAHLWQFLRISDIPKTEIVENEIEVKEEDIVQEINSVDEDYNYPIKESINPDSKFLLEKYAFHIKQFIAKELGLKSYQFMKKATLTMRINERSIDELVDVCEKLQIPFYII